MHRHSVANRTARPAAALTTGAGERVWTYAPARDEAKSWATPGKVCCFATRRGRPWNEVVAAFSDGFAFLDLAAGARKEIAKIDLGLPGVRLNDGRTDREGRFIAGGMDDQGGAAIASVYRLAPNLSATRLFDGVVCANGTCFSPDGRTMWFADSGRGQIEAFDYDPATGTPSGRRAVAEAAAPGVPDGSCVDADGFVWTAVWEGHRFVRYAPDGASTAWSKSPSASRPAAPSAAMIFPRSNITSSRLAESEVNLADHPLSGACLPSGPESRASSPPRSSGAPASRAVVAPFSTR